jgi:hypothetical protein
MTFYYAPHGQKNHKKRTSDARKPKNSMVKSLGRDYKSLGNTGVVEKSSMKEDHVFYYASSKYFKKKVQKLPSVFHFTWGPCNQHGKNHDLHLTRNHVKAWYFHGGSKIHVKQRRTFFLRKFA